MEKITNFFFLSFLYAKNVVKIIRFLLNFVSFFFSFLRITYRFGKPIERLRR